MVTLIYRYDVGLFVRKFLVGEVTVVDPSRFLKKRTIAMLLILLSVLFLVKGDNFTLTASEHIASDHLFSLVSWEFKNFPRKWIHLLKEAIPGNKPSRSERLIIIDEYLQLARKVQKEKNRIEGVLIRQSVTRGSGSATKELIPTTFAFEQLKKEKHALQDRAEEAVEAEISNLLSEIGFASMFGLIWPPVDIRFAEPPTLLVVSPRDELKLIESVLLEPGLDVMERADIEQAIFDQENLSALVDDLAGLATYPNIVSDLYTKRIVMRTAVHEWMHAYFFFKPLGRNLWNSETMFTINETVADLVGRELGDIVFERLGDDLAISKSTHGLETNIDSNFRRVMRETRKTVEDLLKDGRVDEAEAYLREQHWFLKLRGYGIRKLNQAYFAFRGRYAESAASINPIGDQVKELRDLMPSVSIFIREMSDVSSHTEFLELLARTRTEFGGS